MNQMNDAELVEWLFSNGGPILRYRTAMKWMDVSAEERERLFQDCLAVPEVQRWVSNLEQARTIHGSQDTVIENCLAKLLEYGFDRTLPAIDRKIKQIQIHSRSGFEPLILLPFLIRAGYAEDPTVMDWFKDRLDRLYRTTQRGCFDFYLTAEEAAGVPKAWRGKPIYRDEYGSQAGYPLPTCYDFMALASCPCMPGIHDFAAKSEAIVAFLSEPRFQTTLGGYGWDRNKNQCYAAGRVFLACVEPARLVLWMQWGAKFKSARSSNWFQQGLATLHSYKTRIGTYRFPTHLLAEKTGYYIYSGSHMGLGEDRRSPIGLELESTFRLLSIQALMQSSAA
jgi:hypothetical protein